MNTAFLALAGVALMAMMLAVTLRDVKREYALLISLGCGALLTAWAVAALLPVVEQLRALVELTGLDSEYAGILLKSLGVAVCAQLACDACKDAGETAVGGKVEFCARVCLLTLSLPVFAELLRIVTELFGA